MNLPLYQLLGLALAAALAVFLGLCVVGVLK